MINELYLHIGQFKTGSSSLQASLAFHRDNLKKVGVLYPQDLENWHNHLFFAGHYLKIFPIWLKNRSELEFKQLAEQSKSYILSQLAKRDYNKAVLSSENFCQFNDESDLASLYKDLKTVAKSIKVVIYLRHQLNHIDSAYKQRVLTRMEARPFGEFFTDILNNKGSEFDYKKILLEYGKIFGEKNIIVRNFNSEHLVKGDIVCDFNKLLGIHMAYSDNSKNISPSAQNIEFFRLTQSANSLDKMSKQKIARVLRSKKMTKMNGAKYFFVEEHKKVVQDIFSKDNEYLSKKFKFPILEAPSIDVKDQFSAFTTKQVEEFLRLTLYK